MKAIKASVAGINSTYKNVIVKLSQIRPQGLIELPSTNIYGEVISVGPDVTIDIKVGSKVLFEENEGREIEVDGQKLIVLKETYIMGEVI